MMRVDPSEFVANDEGGVVEGVSSRAFESLDCVFVYDTTPIAPTKAQFPSPHRATDIPSEVEDVMVKSKEILTYCPLESKYRVAPCLKGSPVLPCLPISIVLPLSLKATAKGTVCRGGGIG
jgi:hypothetical protein